MMLIFFFFLMIRRPPRSTLDRSSAASDVYKRQSIASAAFGAELLGGSRPVVYAYFGDHQPNLGGPVPYVSGVAHPQYLSLIHISEPTRPY